MSDDALRRAVLEHESYLATERGLASNSLAGYRRDLAHYEDHLRRRGVDDPARIAEADISAFVEEMKSERVEDGARLRYAPATVARALVAVRSLHRFLVDEGVTDSDPSEDLGAPRVPQSIPKALTESEVTSLLDAVAGDDPRATRDRALLELLYASGIRISELVGVDLADLDLDRGLVRVLGKGSKERVVPVGRTARDAVGAYLGSGRPELVGAATRSRVAIDAVFLNARGGRLTRQGAWKIVTRYGSRVGLDGRLSPHVLRHCCATHMLDRGADIRVVQELLGHASISTTQIYTKVSPDRLRAVYDAAHPRARSAIRTARGGRGPAGSVATMPSPETAHLGQGGTG